MKPVLAVFLVVAFAATVDSLPAQAAQAEAADPVLGSMRWRSIGPFRGGRSAAGTGVVGDRDTYYFGAAGGGVFKTTNGGRTWTNVSDGYFGGSIGAVAVAESDPNVIYVGGGEKTVRGNVSHGDGVWKSTDAGKTWKHVGLRDSRRIPRIRIHPKNPDLVYVAALGHLFGPNSQRGVFRSKDGGKSWERILFVSDEVGAVDLCFDPSNPRNLFASTWRVKRTPYSLESGGEGSGLWKSTDGGDSWTNITKNRGLPGGTMGIIGVAVSPARPERVFAILENEKGGVYRSDNAGETWRRTNDERSLRQRAWYYTRIYADPKDADVCYVLNVGFYRSKDAGTTFSRIGTPHGDNHDLWIDPHDPLRMIETNDGGANVSFDGGQSWTPQDNQATAQFYRVSTDNHFPYRIYGAQQDNSTVRIASRTRGFGIGERDWESTAGGESGHIAPHPKDPEIVFGGSYGGFLTRINHRSKTRRNVHIWPDNPMGYGAGDLKYRFQWNFPIFFSPHEPHDLYAAAQVLFRSSNQGQSWTQISPDLTRNDKSKMGPSGGPITKDNTSVEYYGTIFAACVSPHEKDVIWCGSDDGLLHITRDGGKNWTNITPKSMPEWAMINSIDPHPFEKGGLYVAATRYKLDDFRPYLFRTSDYGKTWQRIDRGIDRREFTRVVRADPVRRGLLYAGTERGVWYSLDDGASWKSLQLELPIVPITDLAIKEGDLVAATQGRSFWVLDDLSPLRQASAELQAKAFALLQPRPTWRLGGRGGGGGTRGANPPGGVLVHFWLAEAPAKGKGKLKLEFLEEGGRVIASYTASASGSATPSTPAARGRRGRRGGGRSRLVAKKGMNRFVWDMRYEGAKRVPGMILWGGGLGGPRAIPGKYRVRLSLGKESVEKEFAILMDPRSEASVEDLAEQFEFLIAVRDKLSETHEAILETRRLSAAINGLSDRSKGIEDAAALRKNCKSLRDRLSAIEKALYQTKNKSAQDPLNYPIRLNNRLSGLVGVVSSGDWKPTKQAYAVRELLVGKIDKQLAKLRELRDEELPKLNEDARKAGVPALQIRPTKGKKAPARGEQR